MSMEEIDVERLRRDLISYFEGAFFNGFGAAMIDISEIKSASKNKLLDIAKDNGFDINNYVRYNLNNQRNSR